MTTTEHRQLGQQMYLYRFFNVDGRLLYIGISKHPDHRWDEHAGDKPWWHEVDDQTVERAGDITRALEVERKAIHRERPLYNDTHNHDNPDRVDWRAATRRSPGRRRPRKAARHRGRRWRLTLWTVLWIAVAAGASWLAVERHVPHTWPATAAALLFATWCARPRRRRGRSS